MKEAIPEGGEVIICLGNPDKENTQHRRQGVIDELLDRPAEPNRIPDPLDTPLKGEKYTIVQTLVATGPLFAIGWDVARHRRRPSGALVVGAVIAVVGVALVLLT